MVNRISQLIAYSGLTSSQFADSIEVPRAVLSHIMGGRNKPSLDVILKVVAKYKSISTDWLLLGEGEMLKELATPDASSSAEQEPKAATIPPHAEEAIDTAIPDKVQNYPALNFSELPSANSEKQLKQIVFLYTDNTFAVFKPEV